MPDFSKARDPLDVLDMMTAPARIEQAEFAVDTIKALEAMSKLRRLIERCEHVQELYGFGWGSEARAELRAAIEEAKK